MDRTDACTRCGDFEELRSFRRDDLCARCFPRVHPVFSPGLSARELLRGTVFVSSLVGAPLAALFVAVQLGFATATEAMGAGRKSEPFLVSIAILVAYVLVSALAEGVALDHARRALHRGSPAPLLLALWAARDRAGRLVSTYLWQLLAFSLGLLLCGLPSLYFAVRYAVATPIALFEEPSGRKALAESARRVMPHGWAVFGALLATRLPAWALQISAVLLNDGGPRSFAWEVALSALAGLLVVPGVALVAALYVKLEAHAEPLRAQPHGPVPPVDAVSP